MCLGNICRSPMAEAVFMDLVHKKGLSGSFLADSCGTAGYHIGASPDYRTLKVLENKGIKTNHKGRKFTVSDFENFDTIFVMDKSNEQDILKLAKNDLHKNKVKLLRQYDTIKQDLEVPDPYYDPIEAFEIVYEMCVRCCSNFIENAD